MGADRHNVSVRMYVQEPQETLRHLSADKPPLDGIDCAHVIGLKRRRCCVATGKKEENEPGSQRRSVSPNAASSLSGSRSDLQKIPEQTNEGKTAAAEFCFKINRSFERFITVKTKNVVFTVDSTVSTVAVHHSVTWCASAVAVASICYRGGVGVWSGTSFVTRQLTQQTKANQRTELICVGM